MTNPSETPLARLLRERREAGTGNGGRVAAVVGSIFAILIVMAVLSAVDNGGGGITRDVNDETSTTDEIITTDLRSLCETAVKNTLWYPETARFTYLEDPVFSGKNIYVGGTALASDYYGDPTHLPFTCTMRDGGDVWQIVHVSVAGNPRG